MTKKSYLTDISIGFTPPGDNENSYDLYGKSVQKLIERVIPKDILPKKSNFTSQQKKEYFKNLEEQLPIVSSTDFTKDTPIISVCLICSAYYTHGIGRFMCDMYSRWVIPGKQIPILNVRSLNFKFQNYPDSRFFMNELILDLSQFKSDHILIKNNLPILSKELRINCLAVRHARQIVSIKPLTLGQKKTLIQENLSSLLDRESMAIDPNIFEYMHQFLIKASAEEKITQIKDQIEPLIEMRPTAFDRDIYTEVQKFVNTLNNDYITKRELKHLNRVISYHYIFKKLLTNTIQNSPDKRQISIKILRTKLSCTDRTTPVVAVLVGLNLINEQEQFDKQHLVKAVTTCIPSCRVIDSSCLTENHSQEKIRTVYLEFEKPNGEPFTSGEIKDLRKGLPKEVRNGIGTLYHPLFVHRNEEEVMRSILDLSKQLKYVHDLPQVIVNFHKQTGFELSFIVIMVKLLKPDEPSLKELFYSANTILKFLDYDVRTVGILRKRYPKEANVFEVRLEKKQFLRKDFSIDLYKARLAVVSEITRLIGDVRDYNGGMIAKQHEVLVALKELLIKENISNEFLLENFFYSLTPNYMQSLLSPIVLKELFLMLIDSLEHDFNKDLYYSDANVVENHFLLIVGSLHPDFKAFVTKTIDNLQTSIHEITHSFVVVYDISCVGFLLRFDHPDEYSLFQTQMRNALESWESSVGGAERKNNEDFPFPVFDQFTGSST